MILKEKLPPVYYNLIPEISNLQYPEEKFATCNTCLLAQHEKQPGYETKCCTYQPNLPNYLVGGILSDSDPHLDEGKVLIRKRISERKGVSPFGIMAPMKVSKYVKDTISAKGKVISREEANNMKCPYLSGGNCTIWKYRENCCSTHFCFSVGGVDGSKFWYALDTLLRHLQQELGKYALLELGYPVLNIRTETITPELLKMEDKNGNVDEKVYNELWDKFLGKEEKLYKDSFALISSLDSQQIEKIIGSKGRILSEQVKDYLEKFKSNLVPDFLQFNEATQVIQESRELLKLTLDGEKFVELNPIEFKLIKILTGNLPSDQFIRKVALLKSNFLYKVSELIDIGVLKEVEEV